MRTARAWSTSNVTRSRWFTPTNVAPTDEGPLELGLVVHLDERVETDFVRERVKARELGVREGGRDEQHRVGAHRARVADVASVDREVLAQHRQLRRGASPDEVVWRPAE